MENVVALTIPGSARATTSGQPDQPLALCLSVHQRYRSACLLHQTAFALFVTDNDFTGTFELCARTPEAARRSCHEGLGMDAAYLGIITFITRPGAIAYANAQMPPR